jgi:signal peptidase I
MSTRAQEQKSTRKKSAVRDWIESIVIAFILAMFIRTFIIQAFKIPTGSMRPTLLEGDAILVNKFIYGAKIPFTDWSFPAVRQPRRGDVIVFIYPNEPKKDFIKRMIGLGKDSVEIKNGTVYINDKPLEEPLFNQKYYYNRGEYGAIGKKILVPDNCFFVLGDNSASSQDSRYWGFVPKKNVLGKALIIYWPLNRIRIIR